MSIHSMDSPGRGSAWDVPESGEEGRRDDIGGVLVLTAMAEEAAPIVARLQGLQELDLPFTDRVRAVQGYLLDQEITVVTTGIGVAAAAAATTWAARELGPRLVICAGTAGGLGTEVEVGDLVLGDSFTYSIADATAFGYAPGQVPGGPERYPADAALGDLASTAVLEADPHTRLHRGLMLSGDAFVTAPLAEPMRERFPEAISADMETTAIAQVCSALALPFLALRAISDLCGPRSGQQFHLELDLAAERSARAVEAVLEALVPDAG
jgi:adenosylhomocysteine nucleosidase